MNGSTAKLTERHQQRGRFSLVRAFLLTAGVILAITAIAKMWSAFGGTQLLRVVDPILGVQFRHLMLAVGVAELAIAVVCLFGTSNKLGTGLVAWLATNFLVYRLGLWGMGWKRPCACLGDLTDALHISAQTADTMVKALLAYMLIGSYALLISQCWQRRLKVIMHDSAPVSATSARF